MSGNSDSAGQPSTKEIEEATKELTATTAQIEAETKKLQAEMAKLKAQFPAGSTKPLPGETTVDDKFGYVARAAAYDALTNAAADIAQRVQDRSRGWHGRHPDGGLPGFRDRRS